MEHTRHTNEQPSAREDEVGLIAADDDARALEVCAGAGGDGELDDRAEVSAGGGAEHGVAILMVIACLAVLLPITASFSYTTRVDWQAAVNARDEVTARSLQRGAMRLSLLMFELQRAVFSQKQFREMVGAMDITQVAPYLMSVFGSEDGAEGLVGMAALVGVDGINTEAFKELSLTTGTFEVRLEAESGKVNVNCLAKTEKEGKSSPQVRTLETIEALLLPKLYDPLFDEEHADGQRYERWMITKRLVDYIDDDRVKFDLVRLAPSSLQESAYRYRDLYDPYDPRNARLDSIEELAMVEGVNDDLMMVLGNELTVYGGCKVNLNFASADQVANVIRYAVINQDKWKTEGDNFLLMTMPLANYVVSTRELSLFKDLDAFKEFVEKPDQFFNPMLGMGANTSDQGFGNMDAGMPRIPEGIGLHRDPKPATDDLPDGVAGLKDVATIAPERVYRLEVITEVGAVKKRLSAVYDMQATRTQTKGKGAWLYFRED